MASAAIVAVGLILIAVFGSIIAVRAPVWDAIDEGAHYAYIEQIANHGSLPVLGKTLAPEQVLALGTHVYPRKTSLNPRDIGLGGQSYEAFQPPLYYALAVPAFDLSGTYHTKVIVVRFFDLLLLLCTALLFGRLSRIVLKNWWWVGWAAGMLVYAIPGVVVRNVLISNSPLEMLVVVACLSELAIALLHDRPIRLLTGGSLVGLAILTDLFGIELIPIYAVVALISVRRAWNARRVLLGAGGGGIACALVAPWLAFNESHYHALTAGALAKQMQMAIVNPQHVHYSLHAVIDYLTQQAFAPILPQEWNTVSQPGMSWIVSVLAVLVVPLAAFLCFASIRQFLAGSWMWIGTYAVNLVICVWISYGQQWLTVLARYTYPTLPLLALGMAAGAIAVLRTSWPFVAGMGLAMVGLVVLWGQLEPQVHAL